MLIILDYKDARPLYEQITDKIEALILKGILNPDEQLPSVRNLAMELSINPNTIQKAFSELERRGFIYTVKGRGNFVCLKPNLLDDKMDDYVKRINEILKEAEDIGIKRTNIIERLEK